MGKRPAFQFFPGDEERETSLRLVGLAAYGLWKRMLNLMHGAEPYGHLCTPSGQPIEVDQLAKLVGEKTAVVRRLLADLEEHQVFSRTESGVIFSRRMVRDGHISEVRAAAGRQGGNPALVRKGRSSGADLHKQTPKQTGRQSPTPSSSPSPSCSTSTEPPPPEAAAASSQAVGGTAPDAGGGRLVVVQQVEDQPGKAPAAADPSDVSARIEEIAQRRVAAGGARGGIVGSRKWCLASYQARGEVYAEIHGAPAVAHIETLSGLDVELPEILTPQARAKILGWVKQNAAEAAEILAAVREAAGAFNAVEVGGKFAARVMERVTEEQAAGHAVAAAV